MMSKRMIIQDSVIKVSRCCYDYLANTLKIAIIQSVILKDTIYLLFITLNREYVIIN
jgi:hypothetical protein